MNLPPDDNKVDPEVAAPCLRKFTKPGGRRPPGGSDITTNPRGPVGTGPPPPGGGLTSIGGTPGIPLKFCKCFPLAGKYEVTEAHCPFSSGTGFLHNWTWKQVCLETDSKGEVGGSKDPRGGWAEIARVLRNWPPCAPGYVLSDWGQSDPNKHGKDCLNKNTGNCDDPCDDITIWAICCPEEEPIEEIDDVTIEEVDRFAIPGGSKNKPGGIFY
tara:strand:+ start:1746 stop:2387 length:642 start_codon:yes stop_codon:yes gene_type:complete